VRTLIWTALRQQSSGAKRRPVAGVDIAPTAHYNYKVVKLVIVLLSALTAFVGCSPRNSQHEKDEANRLAIIGVWSGRKNESFGILAFRPDGRYWATNTYGSGSSMRGMGTTGTWNITNDELVCTTDRKINLWNWGTHLPPKFLDEDRRKIVWVTDQELALAVDYEALNLHETNILHRRK
jgi:hypothetical protein